MTDAEQKQLVADLARDVVLQAAPQELPLFRLTSQAYFQNPEKALQKQAGKDELLGFGAAEAVILLTPVVLAVMTDVLKFVMEAVQKSIKEEGSGLVSDAVKQMFKRFRSQEKQETHGPAPLTPEQLTQVRKLAYERARQFQLSEAKAGLLADAMVGGLAIAPA